MRFISSVRPLTSQNRCWIGISQRASSRFLPVRGTGSYATSAKGKADMPRSKLVACEVAPRPLHFLLHSLGLLLFLHDLNGGKASVREKPAAGIAPALTGMIRTAPTSATAMKKLRSLVIEDPPLFEYRKHGDQVYLIPRPSRPPVDLDQLCLVSDISSVIYVRASRDRPVASGAAGVEVDRQPRRLFPGKFVKMHKNCLQAAC